MFFVPCFKTVLREVVLLEVCIPRAACFTAEHCMTLEAFSLAILLAGEEATVLLASCSTAAMPLFRVFLTAVGFSEEPFVWLSKEPVVWFSEEPVVDPREEAITDSNLANHEQKKQERTSNATKRNSYTCVTRSKGHSSRRSAALSRRAH